MSYIGQTIKSFRLSSNMSQEALGKKLGVGRAAVNKWEKGVVENIPLTTVERLAEIFDVSPIHLLGWEYKLTDLDYQSKVNKGVEFFYGKESLELVQCFNSLKPLSKNKLVGYAADLQKLEQK